MGNEQEVIERIKKGEKELYALILRQYNQRLYRVARSILKDERGNRRCIAGNLFKGFSTFTPI
jgi:hypothetical protein